jgi:hypothetical protein
VGVQEWRRGRSRLVEADTRFCVNPSDTRLVSPLNPRSLETLCPQLTLIGSDASERRTLSEQKSRRSLFRGTPPNPVACWARSRRFFQAPVRRQHSDTHTLDAFALFPAPEIQDDEDQMRAADAKAKAGFHHCTGPVAAGHAARTDS